MCLEAHEVMLKQRIDLVPVVEKDNPRKILGVLTSEGVALAYSGESENPSMSAHAISLTTNWVRGTTIFKR